MSGLLVFVAVSPATPMVIFRMSCPDHVGFILKVLVGYINLFFSFGKRKNPPKLKVQYFAFMLSEIQTKASVYSIEIFLCLLDPKVHDLDRQPKIGLKRPFFINVQFFRCISYCRFRCLFLCIETIFRRIIDCKKAAKLSYFKADPCSCNFSFRRN